MCVEITCWHRCLPWSLAIKCTEAGSLTKPEPAVCASVASQPAPGIPCLQRPCVMTEVPSGFNISSGDLNSGPHACMTSDFTCSAIAHAHIFIFSHFDGLF